MRDRACRAAKRRTWHMRNNLMYCSRMCWYAPSISSCVWSGVNSSSRNGHSSPRTSWSIPCSAWNASQTGGVREGMCVQAGALCRCACRRCVGPLRVWLPSWPPSQRQGAMPPRNGRGDAQCVRLYRPTFSARCSSSASQSSGATVPFDCWAERHWLSPTGDLHGTQQIANHDPGSHAHADPLG